MNHFVVHLKHFKSTILQFFKFWINILIFPAVLLLEIAPINKLLHIQINNLQVFIEVVFVT